VRIVARAVVEPSVKSDAVPGERTIVRIRDHEIVEAREARVRRGRRGLGCRCLLLARQIGPVRVTCQESGGREKHHGVTGWLDQSRPKQRFEVGRILAADANAASHKSNPQAQAAPPRAIVKARRAAREAIVREKLTPTVDRGRLDAVFFESGAESRIAVLALPPGR
jgi:hypothetical protein